MMTDLEKLEELAAKLRCHIENSGICSVNNDKNTLVERFTQAVRDEEFEKHTEAECSIRENNQHVGIHHFCATCKEKGTRYCP